MGVMIIFTVECERCQRVWCQRCEDDQCPFCEIERLKTEAHELRGLLETALDVFESEPTPSVSRSWMDTVNEIVFKDEKGRER
jgi:hypothetical protein